MNYAEFNGLGLLGQPIKCINEKETTEANISNNIYEDYMETRNELSSQLEQFIEKKNKKTDSNDMRNVIETFKLFFEENVNAEHYDALTPMEHRITTLDRALNILNDEYTKRHSKIMESIESPKNYPSLIENYLFIRMMNDFIERACTHFNNLPKFPFSNDISKIDPNETK